MDPWKPFPEDCVVETQLETEAAEAITLAGNTITISAMTDQYVKQQTKKTYSVTIHGAIGGFFTVKAQATFKLTLLNPCFDPEFVQISQVELPET